MDNTKLSHSLFTQIAKNNGFSLSGICKAEIPSFSKNKFLDWLASGKDAEMQWLRNRQEEKLNPEVYMKDAKSVLVVGRYFNPQKAGKDIHLSAYIRGEDYHDTMKESLRIVAKELSEHYENKFEYRVCVDTSPVHEKEFARLSGIGWQGKHSIIINQKRGSYFFIGEILTTQESDYYDTPVDDRCGTCTRCIDICPPKAITEPYVVDSNLCTSYQNIEKKGILTNETNWEGWIYGCDLCQQVCPWNKNSKAFTEEMFYKEEHKLDHLTLAQILELTDEDFSALFKKSAAKRTKRRGFIRNALQVWQKKPELADISLVKKLLEDPNEEIQACAQQALQAVLSIKKNEDNKNS